MSSGDFVGILSTEDTARAVASGRSAISAGELCHRQMEPVEVDDPLASAIELLRNSGFASVPVVNAFGHLEGLVTRESIVAAQRFGPLLRSLATVPLRERPDELRQQLTRMQIG